MSSHPHDTTSLHHHVRRMSGRDRHESHRVATPLELLFDLTFVIAFGLGASQFAHALAEGHFASGLLGFLFAGFGICWAWINFSWFASAYDTDDWVFRLATMVQMLGVLVLALGLPEVFASIEKGGRFHNEVVVLGYVIMRVALVFQWLRAAKQDPARRRACITYATVVSLAQVGWVALAIAPLEVSPALTLGALMMVVEMVGPWLAERQDGGTPWHAHHIAERYGLFAIIALGEGVVGTVAALSAVIEHQGWSLDAALVGVAGLGLTFGMWWIYYILPSAAVLHAHRERSFVWGYTQIAILTAIVATGAGLHVAALFIERHAHIGPLATLLTVAVPVGVYLALVYSLYWYLVQRFDPFHIALLVGTAVVVAGAILAAAAGLSMPMCLVVLTLAPAVTVVGYELHGYRHQVETLSGQ